MAVIAKAIIPPTLLVQPMMQILEKELEASMKHTLSDFEQTTQSWRGDKPKFVLQKRPKSGSKLSIVVLVNGGKGKDKWWWLEKGTKVRYATMSDPFVAKTKPGRLASYAGTGRMLFVNKKFPRPGIKARKWIEVIQKRQQPNLTKAMQAAMKKAAKASGHGKK